LDQGRRTGLDYRDNPWQGGSTSLSGDIDWLIDWLISNWVQALMVPLDLGLKNGSFVPHNLIPVQGSPFTLLKFQIAPRIKLLISSGSKKNKPRYTCLSEAKASNSQRKWVEVSSSAPQLLHKGVFISPIKWRCLLRVLCPVRRLVLTLECDISLVLAVRLGPENKFSSPCLSTARTSPPWQMLAIHPVFYFSSYILP
jgi:hypothetical protein